MSPVTRRALLRRAGASALTLGSLPALLAACGGDTENAAGGSSTTTSGPAKAPTPSGTLDYFGWEGYELGGIKDMKSFLSENGVRLRTNYIATLEDVPGKLKSGATGTDLLGVTNSAIPRFDQLQLLEPLDESKLPNLANLLERWQDRSNKHFFSDDDQRIFVPLYFQTPGINYNEAKIDSPPERWQDLLDPKYKKKIGMWAEPNATIALVTKMLGEKEAELPKDMLKDAVDLTRQFVEQSRTVAQTYGDLGNQLASGDIIATFVGFPVVAALAAGAGGQGKNIKTNVTPKDGNFSFSDGFSIAAGADNADAAYAFINMSLDPKVQAEASKMFNGGPVVEGAAELLSEAETTYPIDSYDEVLANASQNIVLPLESDEFVTQGEWIEEFQKLTS